MLHTRVTSLLKSKRIFALHFPFNRCFCQQADDPIQQLFIEKIREYRTRSEGGNLVEPTPELLEELQSKLASVNKNYDAEGVNMTAFPTFEFVEPVIDPISLEVEDKKKKETGKDDGEKKK
ncbi:unnamed protein product [Brassicogethes aeneus]|uniref:ATP synthase-coupling factor 6, mitochondrial n=1 Tax=Brassicogethes aeneus TaxID=1431903 RepID=A0A9P0FQV8_BRAAE|nr:unnamed protein product [Brassicogethes aeneus]